MRNTADTHSPKETPVVPFPQAPFSPQTSLPPARCPLLLSLLLAPALTSYRFLAAVGEVSDGLFLQPDTVLRNGSPDRGALATACPTLGSLVQCLSS